MKVSLSWIVRLVLLLALVLGGWWFYARTSGAVVSPTQLIAAKPIPIDEMFDVRQGFGQTWTFNPPAGQMPGLLEGTWVCRGVSERIPGAADDTLVGFVLRGPDNKIIQQLDHPTNGNFSIRVDSPGKWTFLFDNGGIIRSSARRVRIQGTYHPD